MKKLFNKETNGLDVALKDYQDLLESLDPDNPEENEKIIKTYQQLCQAKSMEKEAKSKNWVHILDCVKIGLKVVKYVSDIVVRDKWLTNAQIFEKENMVRSLFFRNLVNDSDKKVSTK